MTRLERDEDAADQGGDPACWAHLLGDDPDVVQPNAPVVADLGRQTVSGAGGAVWSLPHGGDLDANLVRLGPGEVIGTHRNDELDVLMFVQAGGGKVTIDGVLHAVGSDHLLLVPRGAERSIVAGPAGFTYLSVHRRRGPLTISTGPSPQQ